MGANLGLRKLTKQKSHRGSTRRHPAVECLNHRAIFKHDPIPRCWERVTSVRTLAYLDSMAETLHVFSGQFASRTEACEYSEAQWERPAPDDSWPDEEWDAYEERNPTWALRDDLDPGYMDSDFIETIDGSGRIKYLEEQIDQSEDFEALRSAIPDAHNILVLIMSSSFDGRKVTLRSTPKLTYHGEFRWNQ